MPKPPSWTAVCERTTPSPRLAGSPRAPGGGRMVDVAPGGGDGAAGEHAVPVAQFEGPADRGCSGALLLAHVERQPGGVGEDADHPGVAGQPAGGLRRDRAGEDEFATGNTGGRACGAQSEPVDADPHLRRRTADGGQVSAAQRPTGEGDQRVPHSLAVGAEVPGRAVAVHLRFQGGAHGLAADRVQVPGQVHPTVRADRHPEDPRQPGRVVQRPVGIDRVHPPADRLRGVLRAQRPRGLGEHRVGGGQVDADGLGHRHPSGRDRAGHRCHVGRSHRTLGVGRGQAGQLRQPLPVPDQIRRRPSGEPAVPGQPRLHRHHAVGALHLPFLARGDRAGLRGGQPIDPQLDQRQELTQLLVAHRVRVEVGRIELREVLEHRHPRRHC